MPVLKNPRWERLAQELAQNKTATEAMQLAGYSDPRNSTRLTKKDVIRRRIEELQSRGAERAEVSVTSLLLELEDARSKATDNNQLAAATTAIMGKAKLAGFLRDKIEVTTVDEFDDDDMSIEDIAALLARNQSQGYELTADQRGELAALMVSWVKAVDEYIAGCCAKPVQPIHDIERERRRSGLSSNNQRRITNGNGRG
jgi:phage terminase small subunit